jgi:hypothetical protein
MGCQSVPITGFLVLRLATKTLRLRFFLPHSGKPLPLEEVEPGDEHSTQHHPADEETEQPW